MGSTGTPILLGGGAGVLGSKVGGQLSVSTPSRSINGARKGQADRQPTYATPSPTTSVKSKSPTPSPTSTVFYTPCMSTPTPPCERQSPSPSPMPPPRPERRPSTTPTMPAGPLPTTSNSSLATASSSSSRTLKTPHSKLDSHQSPAVASGYTPASAESSYRETEEERSPTPLARRPLDKSGQRSPTLARRIDRDASSATRERLPPPAMATGPLPPVPSQPQSRGQTQSHSAPVPRTQSPLPPLGEQKKQENRLSQDWVHLNLSLDIPSHRLNIERPSSTSPMFPAEQVSSTTTSSSTLPARAPLPQPLMMPLKKQSPQRPSFERNNTAPISPSRRDVSSRPEYRSRGSFDHLRARDGSPTPPRTRKTSFSTPPQAMLDGTSEKESAGGRLGMFRQANGSASKLSTPPIRSRKSEDGLRKSEDMLRPSMDTYSKKELKAMQKEAQRNLGVATPPIVDREREESGRKTSGLSLKKSSGALKALFKTGKGKDKESTPSPPPVPGISKARSRPSTADGPRQSFGEGSRPRPSLSDDRSMWPSASRFRTPGAATPEPRSVSDTRPAREAITAEREGVQFPGRGSFTAERSLYPAPPRTSTTPRVPSDASERTRKPSRELPPLPMPSPQDPQSFEAHQKEGEKKHSPLGEALPVSSLPYLSMFAGGSSTGSNTNPVTPDEAPLPHTVDFTKTPPRLAQTLGTKTPSPLFKPSKSLHLLSLPELDLDFDLSFDRLNGSPSTPRRASPQKRRPSPDSPSRSMSVSSPARPSARPSPVKRTTSERRRSLSFDGPSQDPWFHNGFDMSGKFASSSSSSAPLLSKPLELSRPDDTRVCPPAVAAPTPASAPTAGTMHHHEYSQSYSSQPSAPSSSDHARTPSNASSTHDTSSPSPPRTPEDDKTAFPGFGLDLETTPTPLVGNSKALGEPIVLSRPPSIPLPAVPTPTATVQTAVVVVEPIKSDKDKPELKKPRECVRRLHTKGRVVRPEMPGNNKTLARDIDRRLLGFRYPSAGTTAADRINTLKNDLMPLLFEIEKRPYDAQDESGNAALRSSMFEWSDALLFELQIEQSAHERGACLEALSAVMESSCLSERAMFKSPRDRVRFTKMMMRIVDFVMGKLGAKGVFHNTLLFSGRTLVSDAV